MSILYIYVYICGCGRLDFILTLLFILTSLNYLDEPCALSLADVHARA